MLRRRDAGVGKIRFVDINDPSYSQCRPQLRAGALLSTAKEPGTLGMRCLNMPLPLPFTPVCKSVSGACG